MIITEDKRCQQMSCDLGMLRLDLAKTSDEKKVSGTISRRVAGPGGPSPVYRDFQ